MAAKALLGRMNQGAPYVVGFATLGGVGYGAYQSVFNVEGGHKAIIYSRIGGVLDETYGVGFHFRLPYLWEPIIFNVRTRAHEYPNEKTGTKDLQMVRISLRVLCRPDPNNLPTIFKNWGPPTSTYDEQAFDAKVLDSILQESLKANVARWNAAELITEREQVSLQIKQELTERAQRLNLIIDEVAITDLMFGTEYQKAVERKQVASQMAQRAQIHVDRAMQEKQQKIVEAQGEQKSAELIGQAVAQSPAYLNLEKIKAARQIAATVSQSQNRVYLNANSLLLDVNEHSVEAEDLQPSAGTGSATWSGWLGSFFR